MVFITEVKKDQEHFIEVISDNYTSTIYDYEGNLKKQPKNKSDNKANDLINNDTKTSVKQYFEYQEELYTLNEKIDEIKTLRDDLQDGLKTEITSVLHAFNYNDFAKIKLTKEGLTISLPVKIYNDYELIYKIDTKLFTYLNRLIGVSGKLNIINKHKEAGNTVYTLELIYELEN